MSGIFVPNGATEFPTGWNETRIEYSADDLDNVTRLTLDGYCQINSFVGGATVTPIIGSKAGIPGTIDTLNGRNHFQVSADSAGRILVTTNPTSETIDASTDVGAYTIGVPFHWMLVWNFTLVGDAKLVLYVNGVVVPWIAIVTDPSASKFLPDALPFGLIVCYVLGGREHGGSDVQNLEIDYIRAWTGTAATSVQAAEYGTPQKTGDGGSLGVPTHHFEFDGNAEDTGSAPFTLIYSQNLSFGDLEHPTVTTPPFASSDGGDMIPLGGLQDGVYRVHFGPNGNATDPVCYSGIVGQGQEIVVENFRCLVYLPRSVPGADYQFYFVKIRGSGPATQTATSTVTVLRSNSQTGVYSLRSILPNRLYTGPRNIKGEA